jgi:protein kinase C substrate 80K-H
MFQCPQQPKLKLPPSRLNDGICDCCDGVDESGSSVSCPDVCDELLAEERAAREKAKRDFQIGFDKRQRNLQAFQELVQKAKVEIEKIDSQLIEKTSQLQAKKSEIDQLKGEYMQKRFHAVSELLKAISSNLSEGESSEGVFTGMFESLTTEEIVNFIHLTCQVSGEMEDAPDESTCVPLRLAGLDGALMWGDENFDSGTVTLFIIKDDAMLKKLASVLDHNAADIESPIWSGTKLSNTKNQSQRRRLDESRYHESDDDDDDVEDDDTESEEDDHDEEDNDGDNNAPNAGKGKELMESVQSTPFSQIRVKFMSRADKVIQLIQIALSSSEASESNHEESEGLGSPGGNVDPAAFQMLRGSLSRRQESIRRGYKYALSSVLLVGSLQEATKEGTDRLRSDLIALAVGTVYHGKIGSDQLWQILQFVVPELRGELDSSLTEEQRTCSSPLTGACPPRSIQRTVSERTVSIPSQSLLRAGDAVCSKLVDEALAGVCAKDDENSIPTNAPEGYYGYFTPQPRNNSHDELAKEFEGLDSLPANRFLLDDLESQLVQLESEGKDLAKQLSDLEDEIGGRDSSNFGFQGELHAFKDACLSVEAGKYIYEVCVFGDAKQKERDGGDSGTDLGHWEGIFVDEETGERVMKWTNGARCWNGPLRSAVVHLTCGTENKVLSAEEPETCLYKLQMESYMACDEAFKARFDL